MQDRYDFIVIGAGIAGATAAYHLAPDGAVLVLERENQPGYHSTGRSAAQFFETYGGPEIVKLNRVSRPFFESPPPGFWEAPLVTERGAMFFARADQLDLLERHRAESASAGASIFSITAGEALRRVPVLRGDYVAGALLEPDSKHMDVAAIHQGFLRGARREGARLVTGAEVQALARKAGCWQVTSTVGRFSAPWVVNAAGAWCDVIAGLAGVAPIGLVPKRRTAILIDPPAGLDIGSWPLTIDIDEDLYFKPDAGRLLVSPADETPVPPCDVQPEDLDIAILVDRLQQATTLEVRRIAHRWAGLRSFVPDHNLVIGEDPDARGFFWLAGQGGYGIQTSPAAGRTVAGLLLEGRIPDALQAEDVTEASIGPGRLRGA